ncbi:DUF6348 family protein [Pendulispora rubella]|uniref:DUF6348 family protein n=1 Tax=Pendulispora rubella TaxID=2741070 RepID=A0ABZ2L1H7_9BACT
MEHGAFAAPIEEQIAAVGPSPETAIHYATSLWIEGVFHPFFAFVHGISAHSPLAMVTMSPSGELLGWQTFALAPLTNGEPVPERMEVFGHLAAAILPQLHDRRAHALKCFIQKTAGPCAGPADKIAASCHLDNREWPEGLSELFRIGDNWGELSSMRLVRQWFFFRPATKADLGESWDELAANIGRPPANARERSVYPVANVTALLATEVPEIAQGKVRVVATARESGVLTKVAVDSLTEGIDAVAACVGQNGHRILAIRRALNGERIDLVPWSGDPARFVCNAMSGCQIEKIVVYAATQEMKLVVADADIEKAMGPDGANLRLAANLTGWNLGLTTRSEDDEARRQGIRELQKIEFVTPALAEALVAKGFLSAADLKGESVEDIATILGITLEFARRLKEGAALLA